MDEEFDLDVTAPWLVFGITLLGVFLRVLLLGMKGMWLDETFSVWMANHSIGEMLQWVVRIDQHPPLYYLLLHYWITLFGDTPYYARLLSALLGAGTIPIMYLIGKRISGTMMGLAAAVLFAVSPIHISFAQETRMYTLLTFNASVAIYALVRLLTDPDAVKPIGSQFWDSLRGRQFSALPPEPNSKKDFIYQYESGEPTGWRAWLSRFRLWLFQTVKTDLAWLIFILFSAATMLSHNTAVFFPLAANVFVLGLMLYQKIKKPEIQPSFQAPSFSNWIKAQIAILILWSPWLPAFIRQANTVYQRFWIPAPTWDAVIQVLKSFLNASAPMPAGQAVVIWSLYVLVLVIGLVHFRKKFAQFLFLLALFTIPLLGELIVSIFRPIFYGRTLIWITIPMFLLLAAGIAQLKLRFLTIGAIGIFGFINLFSASDYFRFYQKEDWSTPAGYVANFAEENDLLLFNSNFVEISFDYYFKPYEQQYSIRVLKQGIPLDLIDDGVLEPIMTEEDIPGLISLLNAHNRVWLVYSHNSYTDPEGLIPQVFASQKKLVRTREFYGGQVQLYENP